MRTLYTLPPLRETPQVYWISAVEKRWATPICSVNFWYFYEWMMS
jgi:hypothetical protein